MLTSEVLQYIQCALSRLGYEERAESDGTKSTFDWTHFNPNTNELTLTTQDGAQFVIRAERLKKYHDDESSGISAAGTGPEVSLHKIPGPVPRKQPVDEEAAGD